MAYLKYLVKMFILFSLLHCILLIAHYISLSLEKYCPGEKTIEDPFFKVNVEGGFVQKKDNLEILIRAKDLEMELSFVAIKDCELKVVLANIHPERTFVELPSWQLETTSLIKNRGFFSLSLRAKERKKIKIHFRYPADDAFKIVLGGDVEEGYFSLINLYSTLTAEKPLFLFIVGDMVDRGTWFRFKMHQDFFDTFPFPVFGVIGDGELDKSISHTEGIPLKDTFRLYQKFYGATQFVIHIGKNWNLLGINNLFLADKDFEALDVFAKANQSKYNLLAAHVPPIDPRKEEPDKRQLVRGEAFLHFLLKNKFVASFYGEIHSFFSFFVEKHQILITGGLGKRLPHYSDYHFVQVGLGRNGSLETVPVFFHLNLFEEWLNKQALRWWGWFYLCWWSPFFRLLHFILCSTLSLWVFIPWMRKLRAFMH